MGNWITELVQLMPPHPGAGAVVDWAAAEEVYGRAFPSDYQDFVRIYGEGSIMQILDVVLPLPESSAGGVSEVAPELAEELRRSPQGHS